MGNSFGHHPHVYSRQIPLPTDWGWMEKKIGCTKVCTVSFMSSGPCPATIAIVPERVFFWSVSLLDMWKHQDFANDKSSAKIQKAPAQEQKFQTLSRKCIKEPEKPPQLVISIPTFIIKFGEMIPWFRHHTLHVSSVAFGMIGFLLLDWNLTISLWKRCFLDVCIMLPSKA